MLERRASRHSRNYVTAFARGLSVIEAFDREAQRMSVSEVAARIKLDRAVTRRLLLTLVEQGFASTDGKQFELTSKVLRLGYSYLAAAGLDSALQPYLDELARAVEESVSVAVLEGTEIMFIARSDAAGRRMSYTVNNGTSLPAYASASGRVLLSTYSDDEVMRVLAKSEIRAFTKRTVIDRDELLRLVQRARKDGYSINDQELDDVLISASVLVRNRSGRAVASLNVSSHVGRLKKQAMIRDVVPKMQACANQLSSLLL